MNRIAAGAAAAAVLFAGCRGAASVQAWRTRDPIRAAILLKASVQAPPEDSAKLQKVELQFEDASGNKGLLDVTPGTLERYDGVVLVSLLPGSYRIRPQATVGTGATEFTQLLEPESMADVGAAPARAGQLDVLGHIAITIRPPSLGAVTGSRYTIDRSVDAKRAIIRQALQFEESFYSGWKEPMEALLKGGLD